MEFDRLWQDGYPDGGSESKTDNGFAGITSQSIFGAGNFDQEIHG